MARKVKVSASALNIRLHPHSAETYANWIQAIFSRKLIAQVHGDRYGMISMLDRSEVEQGIVHGIITTFVRLDDSGSWFSAIDLSEATEDQISEISIPNGLFPNAATFYFQFDCVTHKLYFQTYSKGKSLTPGPALRFFSALSRDLEIMKQFGEAKISIMQDKSSLDYMFGIKIIKEIIITIIKPNSDIFDDDFEKNIEAHLEKTGSREISVSYKAEGNGSIKPDDDINKITQVALENGSVEVVGRDEKGAVRLKSQDYPQELHDQYDPDKQSERNAFLGLIPPRSPAND